MYVGIETVEEYQITGNPGSETQTLLREFLWGDPGRFPEPLAMISHRGSSSDVYHYLHDVLGSVVGLTDADGELAERYTYDPYGRTYVEWPDGQGGWNGGRLSVFGNPFLWTGQRYDGGTGLYAFLFRTYSPSLGRWLQRDPIGYAAGSINLYEYVLGRPLNLIDPFGLLAPSDWFKEQDETLVDRIRTNRLFAWCSIKCGAIGEAMNLLGCPFAEEDHDKCIADCMGWPGVVTVGQYDPVTDTTSYDWGRLFEEGWIAVVLITYHEEYLHRTDTNPFKGDYTYYGLGFGLDEAWVRLAENRMAELLRELLRRRQKELG